MVACHPDNMDLNPTLDIYFLFTDTLKLSLIALFCKYSTLVILSASMLRHLAGDFKAKFYSNLVG